jgi:VCBS repeat-containing protein
MADDFEFTVDDGQGASTSGTFTIAVNAINDAPIAVDDSSYTVDEGATLNVPAPGVTANDSDAEGDVLSVTLNSGPTNGTVTLNSDGNGGEDFATVNLVINPVNDAPNAVADSFSLDEDDSLAGAVLGNDTDAEFDVLTAELVVDASEGSLVLNSDGTFTYSPNADFHGTDSFTYRASDGTDRSVDTTVTISVLPVNDAPVGGDDAFSTTNLEALVVGGMGVLANDVDVDGDPLSVVMLIPPSDGTVTLNSDGTFTYTPSNTFFGTTSFTYMATDGSAMSNPVTVELEVVAFGSPQPSSGSEGVDGDNDSENSNDSSSDNDDGTTEVDDDSVTETKVVLSAPPRVDQTTGTSASSETSDELGVSPTMMGVFGDLVDASLDNEREEFLSQLRSLKSQEISIEFKRGIDFGKVDVAAIDMTMLWSGMDDTQREIEEGLFLDRLIADSTILATTGVAASYILWVMRGSYLVALVASSLPTWAMIDPLPVLNNANFGELVTDSGSAESLINLVSKPAV